MKPSTGILGITALTALLACSPSLAVVHGIEPLSSGHATSQPGNGNGNGYRYNGPAHKYLPAASELTTEAITTTGHWQPNPVQPPTQQLFEHTYSSDISIGSDSSIPYYNGPYRMEYYERPPTKQPQQQQQQQRQQHQQEPQQPQQQLNMNNFQYAADNSGAANTAAAGQFGQAIDLSAGAQHDRRLESSQRGAQLIGQALPERYQRQPFAQPSLSFLQMQSHSYELPPSYSMHSDWYEQESKLQQQQSLHNNYYEQQQEQQHEQQLQVQQQQQQQHEQQLQVQQQQQHEQQQQLQFLAKQHHPLFENSLKLSPFHDHAQTQNAYVAQPSREFQAPYY